MSKTDWAQTYINKRFLAAAEETPTAPLIPRPREYESIIACECRTTNYCTNDSSGTAASVWRVKQACMTAQEKASISRLESSRYIAPSHNPRKFSFDFSCFAAIKRHITC
jgi:hypothetical protein